MSVRKPLHFPDKDKVVPCRMVGGTETEWEAGISSGVHMIRFDECGTNMESEAQRLTPKMLARRNVLYCYSAD